MLESREKIVSIIEETKKPDVNVLLNFKKHSLQAMYAIEGAFHLQVKFQDEPGVDGGGVSREFFFSFLGTILTTKYDWRRAITLPFPLQDLQS